MPGQRPGSPRPARELGGALGISILGSIGIAIYRNDVANGLPAGVPAEAATIARDTLGGAVGVAGQLPGQLGTAVLEVAREAFVQGMQVAAGISAVMAIAVAIVAVVVLRNMTSAAPGARCEPPMPTRSAADRRERASPRCWAQARPRPARDPIRAPACRWRRGRRGRGALAGRIGP